MLARAILALAVLPGLFAGLIPCVLLLIDPWRVGGCWFGAAVLTAGLAGLLWCAWNFYAAGKGTIAPWEPPRHLVAVGLYRLCRNPMYVSVLMIVVGWCLMFGSPLIGLHAFCLAVAFHLRVVFYEERRLAERFGSEWSAYAAAVPRWVPRLRPPPARDR